MNFQDFGGDIYQSAMLKEGVMNKSFRLFDIT